MKRLSVQNTSRCASLVLVSGRKRSPPIIPTAHWYKLGNTSTTQPQKGHREPYRTTWLSGDHNCNRSWELNGRGYSTLIVCQPIGLLSATETFSGGGHAGFGTEMSTAESFQKKVEPCSLEYDLQCTIWRYYGYYALPGLVVCLMGKKVDTCHANMGGTLDSS